MLYPEKLTIPAAAEKIEKTIATPTDIEKLFTTSTTLYKGKRVEDRLVHAYRFAVLTGLRPGELIGLRPGDISGSKVRITQSINNYGEITKGKNDNARRTYTLDSHALKVLDDQRNMMLGLGQISQYVFSGTNLGYVTQSSFRKAWQRYCIANGIEGANTPYELRHTFVSINTDMPDGLKKLVMGHSKDMDTAGTYGHEKADDMNQAAKYISSAFEKILGW